MKINYVASGFSSIKINYYIKRINEDHVYFQQNNATASFIENP